MRNRMKRLVGKVISECSTMRAHLFIRLAGAPHPFHAFHMKTLAYVPSQRIYGRAKVRQLRRHQFVIKLDSQ